MAGFPVDLCWLCEIGRFQCYKGARGQGNRDFTAGRQRRNCRLLQQACATTGSRSRRGAIEAVIQGMRPDMLHAITSGDFHGQIGPSSRMTNGNPSVTGPVLHVTGLTKSYRTAGEQVAVLRGVNLAVAAGESVALTGESGSGKSTLLHLIAGLDAADDGEIRLADAQVSELSDAGRAELRRDRLGLVFQQFNLIPSLTVEDNLVFQSRIAGRHDPAWHRELVERLGLDKLLKRYPEQLSGGQQQRVAIGRALAVKPLLLLADEPTGNLDEDTADEVLALARDLVTRSGCGFLMVTHSERLAATLDRRVNLHAGVIA
jgi:putative ABC transport system ATP-binding protein